jgi:tartrate dehydratase alpha subunit/fumarate hydratase class I-like protein
MKREYDFSKGTRGRFCGAKAGLDFPVYLNPDVQRFVEQIARSQRSDVSRVVNQLMKFNMRLAKTVQ